MSSSSAEAVQDYYPEEFAHCFGCGRLNAEGHRLKTHVEGEETVTRFQPSPHHMAVPGYVYGGLIASLIDCHAMATAAAASERASGRAIGEAPSPRFVTASLRVDYLRPTPLGPELEVRGRVTQMGPRKIMVEATVSADGVVTARGTVTAVPMPDTMATRPPR